MKAQFRLFRRGQVYYVEDVSTGRQESLRTTELVAARRLLAARNEAHFNSHLNLQLARTYLLGSDPQARTRTWRQVMAAAIEVKQPATRLRWESGMRQAPFDLLRDRVVIETRAEDFLSVLRVGTVATNCFLRQLHNFTLEMGWIPGPILPRRLWPKIKFKEKRAITREEHERILASEKNPEWRLYYQLLWHLGGSQSDIASLLATDIDWQDRVVSYRRAKTLAPVIIRFSEQLIPLLSQFPKTGPLFPMLCQWRESDRAKGFIRRCRLAGVQGVSLHSYRYAWAERAKSCGFPERFAKEALGHGSDAVHRAYARKAMVKVPALDDYEREHEKKLIAFPGDAEVRSETHPAEKSETTRGPGAGSSSLQSEFIAAG